MRPCMRYVGACVLSYVPACYLHTKQDVVDGFNRERSQSVNVSNGPSLFSFPRNVKSSRVGSCFYPLAPSAANRLTPPPVNQSAVPLDSPSYNEQDDLDPYPWYVKLLTSSTLCFNVFNIQLLIRISCCNLASLHLLLTIL